MRMGLLRASDFQGVLMAFQGRQAGLRAGFVAVILIATLDTAAAQSAAAPVTVTEVGIAPIGRELALTGTVTSPRSSRVSSEIAGRVDRMLVEAGDRLAAGDLILVLDPEIEETARARARAAVSLAEEELADARRRLAEAEPLAADNTLPETELKNRASEVRRREASLDLARAELRRQEVLLARHRVVAPFAGVVARKLTEVGEWVDPGTAVAELVATDGLRVDFQAPQEVFPSVGPDSRIRVEPGSTPGEWFDGRIVTAVPVSDPQARTFLLRVTVDGANDRIAPGMSANGRLAVGAGREGVVLPRDALLRYPDGRIVAWTVGPDDTVSERVVETGLGFDGLVEITRGLEPGERVVVRGNELLREGQSVTVREGAE